MQGKWTYPKNPDALYRTAAPQRPVAVAVLPFREDRPYDNTSGTYFWYLVPLMPFGWANYERPESSRMFFSIAEYDFQMDEDLGKAAARSLTDSGLVERAWFTMGGETDEADYILHGTTHRSLYHGRIISYGLSVFGPLLWFFGLPGGTSGNTLDFSLELQDRSGQVVWTHRYSGEDTIVQGLYYRMGNDMITLAELMQEGMNEALEDLAARLPML